MEYESRGIGGRPVLNISGTVEFVFWVVNIVCISSKYLKFVD